MSSAPARNRLPEQWRLGEGEHLAERSFYEERWASARQFELCGGPTADLPDAAVLTSLNWEGFAKSYFGLVSRIHNDQRMERLEGELRVLSERVKELEALTASEAACVSAPQREDEHTPSPDAAPEPQASAWAGIDTVEFRSTEAFERDLESLPAAERERIVATINTKCQLLIKNRSKAGLEFMRPIRFLLHGGLESSLSEIRAARDKRVILTVDDDPIFGQVIVTLMRVVRRGDRRAAYDELAELLYPEQILDIQAAEE